MVYKMTIFQLHCSLTFSSWHFHSKQEPSLYLPFYLFIIDMDLWLPVFFLSFCFIAGLILVLTLFHIWLEPLSIASFSN